MENSLLQKRYHFVGINGSGMAPLARLLAIRGYSVSGSDKIISEYDRKRFSLANIKLLEESDSFDCDYLVVSSAIPTTHPSLLHAKKLPYCEIKHRSIVLSEQLNKSDFSIGIAGSHGKSTTSWMISWLLSNDFSCFPVIGADLDADFRVSITIKEIVAELDESDGSIDVYRPSISVITGLSKDHLDYFSSLDHIAEELLSLIPRSGVSLIHADDFLNYSNQIQSKSILTYGREGSLVRFGYQIKSTSENGTSFLWSDKESGIKHEFYLPLFGEHNVSNATAAIAVAFLRNLPIDKICYQLKNFPGVKKRQQRRDLLLPSGEFLPFFIDYAHNPRKIAACISSLRQIFSSQELCVIWQPHRYSRTKSLATDFLESFHGCDELWILDIFASSEKIDDSISTHTLAKSFKASGLLQCFALNEKDYKAKWEEAIASSQIKTKVFVLLSAGDVSAVSPEKFL